MKSIEQLKAEHAKQLATLERELYLASLLPVEPRRVMLTGSKLYPWVTYEASTIQEVKGLFNKFDVILPITYAKKGCTIVGHIEEHPEYKDSIIAEGYCLKIEVSQGAGFGPCVKFIFYTEIQGEKLRIGIDFKSSLGRFGAHFTYKTQHHSSSVIAKSANTTLSAYSDNYISFYSGEPNKPSANYTYLFVADNVDCTEFSNMFSMLDAIAEAFKV